MLKIILATTCIMIGTINSSDANANNIFKDILGIDLKNLTKKNDNNTDDQNNDSRSVLKNTESGGAPLFNNSNGVAKVSDNSEKTVTIIAEGVGETRGKAKEDAARNSVEKAVGKYVSADLKAKNDEIIKDEVLSLSAGYINKIEIIEEKRRDDGLFLVKVRAEVTSTKLIRHLRQLNINTTQIDSDSLFAEATTKMDSISVSKKLWGNLFSGYPYAAIETFVSGKPWIVPASDNEVYAIFKVGTRFKSSFVSELSNIFDNSVSDIRRGSPTRGGAVPIKLIPGNSTICIVDKTSGLKYPDFSIPNKQNELTYNFLEKYNYFREPVVSNLYNFRDKRLSPYNSTGDIREEDSYGRCGQIPFDFKDLPGYYKYKKNFRNRASLQLSDIDTIPHIKVEISSRDGDKVVANAYFERSGDGDFIVEESVGVTERYFNIFPGLMTERLVVFKLPKDDLLKYTEVSVSIQE